MSDIALMKYSGERGDSVFSVSPSSQYPEEKFLCEDLDVVRAYINLTFGETSANEGSAKDNSVKESTAGGVSAACGTPWLLLQ